MKTITKFRIVSAFYMACQRVVELVMSENTYSRYEWTPTNIFFP